MQEQNNHLTETRTDKNKVKMRAIYIATSEHAHPKKNRKTKQNIILTIDLR